ncbi:DUF6314 family protein [Actibacterium sp. D379-3]
MPRLDAFAGEWIIRRDIEDARAGGRTRFEGRALLTPDGAGLRYDEEGLLQVPGQPAMAASRRYLWRPAENGIVLFFADGRPFHVIGPGQAPQATHHCDPDLYQVSYDFGHWPGWQATWRVTGPRKDYVMRSDYSRKTD